MRLPTRSALAAAACALVAVGSGTAVALGQPVRDTTVTLPRFDPAPAATRTTQPGPTAVLPAPTPAAAPAPRAATALPAPRAATAAPKPRRAVPRTTKPPVSRTPARSSSAPRPDDATPLRQLRRSQQQFARQFRAAFPWWPIG